MDKKNFLGELTKLVGDKSIAAELATEIDKEAAQNAVLIPSNQFPPEDIAEEAMGEIANKYPDHFAKKFPKKVDAQPVMALICEYLKPDKSEAESKDPAQKPVLKSIKVKLASKIAAYGGGFYDRESKIWIEGKKAVEVPKTFFVMQKIANGELIEV